MKKCFPYLSFNEKRLFLRRSFIKIHSIEFQKKKKLRHDVYYVKAREIRIKCTFDLDDVKDNSETVTDHVVVPLQSW